MPSSWLPVVITLKIRGGATMDNVEAHPTVPGASFVCGKMDGIGEGVKLQGGHGLGAAFGYPKSTWHPWWRFDSRDGFAIMVGVESPHIGASCRPVDDARPRVEGAGGVVWIVPWESNGATIRAGNRS